MYLLLNNVFAIDKYWLYYTQCLLKHILYFLRAHSNGELHLILLLMEDCEDDQEDYQLQGILSLFWVWYFPQQSMCTDFYVLDTLES